MWAKDEKGMNGTYVAIPEAVSEALDVSVVVLDAVSF